MSNGNNLSRHDSTCNVDRFSRADQFDRIDSRLRRLEQVVQNNAEACGPEHTTSSVEVPPDDSFYRGDSSFEVHSGATGQVLGDAIDGPEYRRARRESPTSLSALQSFVHTTKSCNHAQFEHDLTLPSKGLVLKAVRLTKGELWQLKNGRHALIYL